MNYIKRYEYHLLYTMLIIMLVSPVSLYAYIDPNTGGYVFQSFFPLISAIVVIFLFFKNQTVALFNKFIGLFKKKQKNNT